MSAAERVARGAAMLDEKRPGWASHLPIDVVCRFWPAVGGGLDMIFGWAGLGAVLGWWRM